MNKAILLIILFTCINCFASTSKVELRRLIKHSEFVGTVYTDKVEKINGCGYLVSGKVAKTYKGKSSPIKFWITSSKDINSHTKKYFVIAHHKNKDSANCTQSKLYTGKNIQTIFPFDILEGDLILANRQSFLTTTDGQYYVFDDLVKKFKVINGKIHAMASWEQISKQILSTN